MELKVLRRHGWTLSALARQFGLNRRTVKREVESLGPRHYPERHKPCDLTAAQLSHVERRLVVCPAIRGTDVHRELRTDYGYLGSYAAFERRFRELRPLAVREPEVRFETEPGKQTQADWAHCGLWPLGNEMVELFAMVTILGCSRAPAFRFATDRTRDTSLRLLVHCLDDLGGITGEVLTDRDPAFCIGSTSDGRAILAHEWVDLCTILGTVPKACRPYRAKTKGKVERLIREVKESFLCWLTGQVLPVNPSLATYDAFARQWIEEVVLSRRHRTTQRVIGDAWNEEMPLLMSVPERVLNSLRGNASVVAAPTIVDLSQRRLGEHVDVRSLDEYEAAL